jgi:hypothetical protein
MVADATAPVHVPLIQVVAEAEPTVADLPAMLLHVVAAVLVVLVRPTQSQAPQLDSAFQELVT